MDEMQRKISGVERIGSSTENKIKGKLETLIVLGFFGEELKKQSIIRT